MGYKVCIKDETNLLESVWNKRVVLLVDELDRCSKETIASLFDSIQLFEENEEIFTVYAIDRQVISLALDGKIASEDYDNYFKKYMDYYVVLRGINKDYKATLSLINLYDFSKNEIQYLVKSFYDLNANITAREVIKILNFISDIKSEWYDSCVKTDLYKQVDNEVLDFLKFIPWAVAYIAGEKWPIQIITDFNLQKGDYATLSYMMDDNEGRYIGCPKYFRDTLVRNAKIYAEWISRKY